MTMDEVHKKYLDTMRSILILHIAITEYHPKVQKAFFNIFDDLHTMPQNLPHYAGTIM